MIEQTLYVKIVIHYVKHVLALLILTVYHVTALCLDFWKAENVLLIVVFIVNNMEILQPTHVKIVH